MVNFLYPIGFSYGGELVILLCESYFLSFISPLFSVSFLNRVGIELFDFLLTKCHCFDDLSWYHNLCMAVLLLRIFRRLQGVANS